MILETTLSASKEEIDNSKKKYIKKEKEIKKLLCSANYRDSSMATEKLRSVNKLTTLERIKLLTDRDSEILEIAPLAGSKLYKDVPPGGGITTAIIEVTGIKCMVFCNESSVKGGAYFPITVKKHLRAQQIAEECHLPCLYLADSAGAYLPMQDEVFPDRDNFGRIFYNQARMSAKSIPQLALVLGSSTAGGAYVPAMCDETIMVHPNAAIYLGGPPLVKAATGEIVTSEELGGCDTHCTHSGVSDYIAHSEEEGIQLLRKIISTLPSKQRIENEHSSLEPLSDINEIYHILQNQNSVEQIGYEVISRLVDNSYFLEFKKNYGITIKCGYANLCGIKIGIIANSGVLFSESALKATHFIELCNRRGIPLLFLQNITGFMIGKKYEREGIAKHGAKMVNAVANCKVPKVTLIYGGSFGAGNYSMAGRAYDPNFLFTWPNSEISVMGAKQAAEVMTTIKFKDKSSSKEASNYTDKLTKEYTKKSKALYSSSNLWDDGIIMPNETREKLALAFSSCLLPKYSSNYSVGVMRM